MVLCQIEVVNKLLVQISVDPDCDTVILTIGAGVYNLCEQLIGLGSTAEKILTCG